MLEYEKHDHNFNVLLLSSSILRQSFTIILFFKGLFARGVSFSGNALTPWVLQDDPLRKAQILGTYLGCPSRKTKDLVECLKERPTRQVVESIKIMRPWLFNPFSPLGVVVEKSGSNKFLAEHPYSLLKDGRFYDVPWITSLTSEEGLYPAAGQLVLFRCT